MTLFRPVLMGVVLGLIIPNFGCGRPVPPEAFSNQMQSKDRFSVLSLNTENLFDTLNDPKTQDDEFTPNGTQFWTEKVKRDKMKNLAEIVITSRAEIVGLVEIENEKVLTEWRTQYLESSGYKYQAISPRGDNRGIRNAVVSKFPILFSEGRPVPHPTREIFEAIVEINPSAMVTLFVNHWPSRRSGEKALRQRIDVARTLRTLVSERLTNDPKSYVIALGDFNDDVTDQPFVDGLPVARFPNQLHNGPAGMMYALSFEWFAKPSADRGTYYFHQEHQWNTLDHILVAGTKSQIKAVEKSFKVVRSRFAKNGIYPRGCDIRERKELRDVNNCPSGATDHRPVMATFAITAR